MSKIYLVTAQAVANAEPSTFLVRAKTRAGAVAHIAASTIRARIPTQDELVRAATAGAVILNAADSEETPNE